MNHLKKQEINMEVVAKDEVWDVIVVGAGLAGLKAALELKSG
jgi:monoamine oxidase